MLFLAVIALFDALSFALRFVFLLSGTLLTLFLTLFIIALAWSFALIAV